MRNWLIEILTKLIDRDLKSPEGKLTEEQERGLMAMLWNNQAFRQYIADRDKKLIYAIVGVAGEEPEPRSKTLMKHGQRVELLLLASKARSYSLKQIEVREELAKAHKK